MKTKSALRSEREVIEGFEQVARTKRSGLVLTYWKQPSAVPKYNDHERDAIEQLRSAARVARKGKAV